MVCGTVNGMKLRIDRAGRLVLPKSLRSRLGLKQEGELEAVDGPEGVLLRPVMHEPAMIRIGGLWVHTGKPEPGHDGRHIVDEVREERDREVSGLR